MVLVAAVAKSYVLFGSLNPRLAVAGYRGAVRRSRTRSIRLASRLYRAPVSLRSSPTSVGSFGSFVL